MLIAEYEVTFVCKKKVRFETEERNASCLSHMAKDRLLKSSKKKKVYEKLLHNKLGLKITIVKFKTSFF